MLAALAAIWLGVDELSRSARHGDLMSAARSLAAGRSLSAPALASAEREARTLIDSGECRSDILRAGLTVILANLDRQNSYREYEAWAAAMRDGDAYLVHAIGCTPTDGDLWARLAMIRLAIAENPAELAWLMQQSIAYAPVEYHVLTARFVVWRKASAATLVAARKALDRDLLALLTYASRKQIVELLTGSSDPLAAVIRQSLRRIPADRRAGLFKAGLDPALQPADP